MPPYRRDPISMWFDRAAGDLLARAYARPGRWAVTYLAPPSRERRRIARETWGVPDLDERDRWGATRWLRAFKRATYWNHRNYGYAEEFRPGDQRAAPAAATALVWDTGPMVRLAGWPTRRREIRVMIMPGGDIATDAAGQLPAAKRYTADDRLRSKPGPPDRPWEG